MDSSSLTVHKPILVQPIIDALQVPFLSLPEDAPPHWVLDCTLGGGGHTTALLKAFSENKRLQKHKILSIDQDLDAFRRAQVKFQKELEEGRIEIRHQRFSEALDLIQSRPVLGLLADLGFSSDQLEDPARGLSFQSEGPLDMRLDPERGVPCSVLLSRISERELEALIRDLGEERLSRRFARAIIDARENHLLPSTTRELSDLIFRATPGRLRYGRIHPATRTFQALRIAVNDELGELDRLLEHLTYLRPTGRAAILSFHSLEDRRVKNRFREQDLFRPLTKKPVQADEDEVRMNPRARSAKLRVAERI